jgi:hypothetical protein
MFHAAFTPASLGCFQLRRGAVSGDAPLPTPGGGASPLAQCDPRKARTSRSPASCRSRFMRVDHPCVAVVTVDALSRCRKGRIGEGADRDRNQIRQPARLPPDGAAATRAEVERDVVATVGRPDEGRRFARGVHVWARKEGSNTERAARAALAFQAMAQRDEQWIAFARDRKLAAGTGGNACRHPATIDERPSHATPGRGIAKR